MNKDDRPGPTLTPRQNWWSIVYLLLVMAWLSLVKAVVIV